MLGSLCHNPAQVYKDDNHKPEMAIALTDFEALCGFVEHAELVHALQTVPELQSVVGQVCSPPGVWGLALIVLHISLWGTPWLRCCMVSSGMSWLSGC